MKPEESETNSEDTEAEQPITGDVIGETAYSERFVLKILLKLANLDTLKDELKEKAFEDDLCTLWDMTAERDVVLFLQKHDVLNLFNFALPVIESPRIIEIVVGIIGNMSCQKEVVTALLKMNSFLQFLLNYVKSDDSLILIQVLRLINSTVYIAEEADIKFWIDLFKKVEYSTSLYFILKNSSNKDLLTTALENVNTIFSCCNIEETRSSFFTQFITLEGLDSLTAAFAEIVSQRDSLDSDEFERILVICLQLLLSFVGFNKSSDNYNNVTDSICLIITKVLDYYEYKLVDQKEIDTDIVDVIESTNAIAEVMELNSTAAPEKYFNQCFRIWKVFKSIDGIENGSDFDKDCRRNEIQELCAQITEPLATLLCSYMEKCSDNNLRQVLDDIGSHYNDILSSVNVDLKAKVTDRSANYKTRLKDTVDS